MVYLPGAGLPHVLKRPLNGCSSSISSFGIRKLESLGKSCGFAFGCVILRLAVSVEHRLVTDGWTDGHTDRLTYTRRQLIPALASVAQVKKGKVLSKGRML